LKVTTYISGTKDNDRLINNTWEKYMFVLRNNPEWFGHIMPLGSNIIQTVAVKWRWYEYVEEDVQKGELEITGTVERQCRRRIIPVHNDKLYEWKYKIWDYYSHVAIVLSLLGCNTESLGKQFLIPWRIIQPSPWRIIQPSPSRSSSLRTLALEMKKMILQNTENYLPK